MRDRSRRLSVMARPGGEFAVTQTAQFPAQRLSGDADPELFPQPLAEIDQTPAHDTVDGRDRTALDGGRQRRAVVFVQPRLRPRRLAIDQTIRPCRVEPQHPVPNDLQADIADPSGITAAAAIVDRRQRLQPTCLLRILRSSCQPPQICTSEVGPKRYRSCHREHPAVRHGESHQPRVGQAL